jgi:hypothetical protein
MVREYKKLRDKKRKLIAYGMDPDDVEYHPVVKKLKRKLFEAMLRRMK